MYRWKITKIDLTMKKLLSLISLLILTIQVQASEEKIVSSSIEKVTVYSQGAQIYRKATYTVTKGITEVIIEGVSANIDPKSLQVKATGSVIILDSKFGVFYPQPAPVDIDGLPLKVRKDIQLLEDSLKVLNYELSEIQDEIDVLQATKNMLNNNGAMRGQGKVNDSIPLLKDALEYYLLKMTEINKKMQVLVKKKMVKVDVQQKMNVRLNDLRNYQNNANLVPKPTGPVYRITVTLSAADIVKGNLEISYLVANAGWVPMYDLRSEITSGKVNLSYKAHVYQNTGIDWEDVRLTISTNNPYMNKTKPTLHPWYIDYFIYQSYNQNKPARSGSLKEKAEAYGYDEINAAGAPVTLDAETQAYTSDQFVQTIDHVISAEFRIDLPYTIKSNNQQHMVLVKTADLDATYKYFTVPKYDNGAYLVAQLSKLDELQLVPAKANIFFDGSYIGETYLDPTTMDDTLNLSLGKDPNIVVKRTLLKNEFKEKIVGNDKERTYTYNIEVLNLKSTNIDIVVQDQLPITQNAEIEITAIELDKGKVEENSGIIEWSFTLKPKVKREIKFSYKVKHPKDKNLQI